MTLPAYDSVVRRLTDTIDLRRLPPLPTSGAEWRERAMSMCDGMPGLRQELASVPIGWFSLIERAVTEIRRLLMPDQALHTTQLKEKFGTLRWYGHVEIGSDGWDDGSLVLAPTDWAEEASAQVCAAFGTADGAIDRMEGYLLTLSPQARRMRIEDHVTGRGGALSNTMYPRWVDM